MNPEIDESDEDLEPLSGPIRPRHLSDMLNLFSPLSVEIRGENAFHAAVKFFGLLQEEVKDDEWRITLVKAWLSAVKNRNYSRFAREYRRWRRSQLGPSNVKLTDESEKDPSGA